MRAFGVPEDLTIASRYGRRHLTAAVPRDHAGGLDPSSLVLAIHDEDILIRQALIARRARSQADLCFYDESELAAWRGWPMRLGRDPAAPDGAVLHPQLVRLREWRHGRRHFRIAIVGGFGFNLGDTVLGATAWRAVAPILAAALPSIAADVLLGPTAHPAIATLVSDLPLIDSVYHGPITVAEFSRYDGYFDFTALIRLARFHEGAHVDWLLWWMGLDPAQVPAKQKRNHLRLPAASIAFAKEKLFAVTAIKIGFVWQASTPLRSMPEKVATVFARELLEAAPSITLVLDQPLPLIHPRVIQIEATSAFDMMALVAKLDGLVTIDSLAQHVADAADIPAVLILNTLPQSRFPYYPKMAIVTPCGAEALPGWGVTKVGTEAWPAMADDYASCWAGISAASCWSLLEERLKRHLPSCSRIRTEDLVLKDQRPVPAQLEDPAFPYDRPSLLDQWTTEEMSRLATVVLGPGRTAVLAGGDGALALRLALLMTPDGALHVCEPRRLRAQALAAAAHVRDIDTVHLHSHVAGIQAGHCTIAAFDPRSESDPAFWGNLLTLINVAMQPLDALNLAACDLIAIRPPHAWLDVLAGAEALIAKNRPVLLIGPVKAFDHSAIRDALAAIDYVSALSVPADQQVSDGALLLATAEEMQAEMKGFAPLAV